MIRNLAFAAIIALACLTAPAHAQQSPPPGTLMVTAQGQTAAVWAFDSGQFGLCFTVGIQAGSAWTFPGTPLGCTPADQILNTPGGVIGFITSWVPVINIELARLFPPSGGGTVLNQLNTGIQTQFKFIVAPNQTVTLAPK